MTTEPTVPVKAKVTPSPLPDRLGIVWEFPDANDKGQAPAPIGVHEFQTTDASPDPGTSETGIPESDAFPAFTTVTV